MRVFGLSPDVQLREINELNFGLTLAVSGCVRQRQGDVTAGVIASLKY